MGGSYLLARGACYRLTGWRWGLFCGVDGEGPESVVMRPLWMVEEELSSFG